MENLKELLKGYDKLKVETYVKYINYISTVTDKNRNLKNPWMRARGVDFLADCFKKVEAEGLTFDGKHITLQKTGVSYDYQAYKNKMIIAYPESLIDLQLVYKDD